MEFQKLDQLKRVAAVAPARLTKAQKLELWAEALERLGETRLRTLFQIEHTPPALRAAMREDNSPLSVAFADPRLRAEGLSGDTVGDAVTFFDASERELHDILCFCHHGETMSACAAASRVRAAAVRAQARRGLPVAPVCFGGLAAMVIATAMLV
ncbi:MAG: hypothetical protein IRY94_13955 [Rhodospirillaceae bacterium]|nr:hypothetical protein [Rhodospirillaceae bacterium]